MTSRHRSPASKNLIAPTSADRKYLDWLEGQLADVASTDLTMLDLFCGSGGPSMGAVLAGITVRHAANHWDQAIAVHRLNHQNTNHSRADITDTHPRFFPQTDILWASPECTNHSPAKGVSRRKRQVDTDGEGRDIPAERSRVMMNDVTRFMEYAKRMGSTQSAERKRKPYKYVVVENVMEVTAWEGFGAWCQAIRNLGYSYELVSLNTQFAHGSDFLGTPQSRDRLFVVCWDSQNGIPAPDLDIRPPAWCDPCDEVVGGVQTWKGRQRIGKYNRSYNYTCENLGCGAVVDPFALPALSAIDFSISAPLIKDRPVPPKPGSKARIESGFRAHGVQPLAVQVGGSPYARPGHEAMRTRPVTEPATTQTATPATALVCPPLEVLAGSKKALVPFPELDLSAYVQPVQVLNGAESAGHFQLPTALADQKSNPGKPGAAVQFPKLVEAAARWRRDRKEQLESLPPIENLQEIYESSTYRMVGAEEIKLGQGFPKEYQMFGTKKAQVRMHGNAVPPPAARLLLNACVEALYPEMARKQTAKPEPGLELF